MKLEWKEDGHNRWICNAEGYAIEKRCGQMMLFVPEEESAEAISPWSDDNMYLEWIQNIAQDEYDTRNQN